MLKASGCIERKFSKVGLKPLTKVEPPRNSRGGRTGEQGFDRGVLRCFG